MEQTQELKVDRRRGPRAGVHQTRNQESREAEPIHDDPIDFANSGPLPNIPARPGYVQRWIRVQSGTTPDARNAYAAKIRGWTPRSPGTVSKALQELLVQREGSGGVIGTHDLVLMERPEELNLRETQAKRRDRRELERGVKNNLFSEYKSMGGAGAGFTAPDDSGSSAKVETGRRPTIQDD